MRTVRHTPQETVTFSQAPRMLVCAVAMAAYCYGINNIGYFTSTTLFCTLMLATLSGKRKVGMIVLFFGCSVGFNVILFFLFRAMKVFMPSTPLL